MTGETNQQENMPIWARKVDDFGKRHWHKEKPLRSRRGEHIWAIIWNIIILWVVNKIPDWNISVINDHYNAILVFLNINIYIQIAVHTIMAFLEARWLYYLLKIVSEASTCVLFILIYYIYPFDFSKAGASWLDILLPFLFIIIIVITAVSIVVYLFRLIFYRY